MQYQMLSYGPRRTFIPLLILNRSKRKWHWPHTDFDVDPVTQQEAVRSGSWPVRIRGSSSRGKVTVSLLFPKDDTIIKSTN